MYFYLADTVGYMTCVLCVLYVAEAGAHQAAAPEGASGGGGGGAALLCGGVQPECTCD